MGTLSESASAASTRARLLKRAARRVVAKYAPAIRDEDADRSPRRRRRPDEWNVWSRYCYSMLTTQQRSTWEFRDGLRDDPRWTRLLEGRGAPNARSVEAIFRDHAVRHAAKKARCFMVAWDFPCQFADLARLMHDELSSVHHAGAAPPQRRAAEVRLADQIWSTLAGCNVGPKIARLMLVWDPDTDRRDAAHFCNVIPLDSKWKAELQEFGADLAGVNFSNGQSYLEIEDALCHACFAADVAPGLLDAKVFEAR